MINCDFNLCIYNKKYKCGLKNIYVHAAGYCDSCIMPDIPEKLLEACKKELFDRLSDEYEQEEAFKKIISRIKNDNKKVSHDK